MSTLTRMPLRTLFGAVCLMTAAAAPAIAEVVQIPGPAFVRQCPCDGAPVPAIENAGTIAPALGASSYFAALPFAGTGQVCSMTMVYRDANQKETLTASLYRKRIQVGAEIDAEPFLIARAVSAAGVVETVRKVKATMISNPAIDTEKGFFYVRADFQNINMDLVGVQVEIQDACRD